MPAGRPHGPNDPSLMSSLETAVTGVRRPGPVEVAWNWRWELAILAVLAVSSGLIAGALGLLGLSVATGAGLAASAATLLLWPSARRWCVGAAWPAFSMTSLDALRPRCPRRARLPRPRRRAA